MSLESAISAVVQVKIALSGIFADRQNSGRSSAGGWDGRKLAIPPSRVGLGWAQMRKLHPVIARKHRRDLL